MPLLLYCKVCIHYYCTAKSASQVANEDYHMYLVSCWLTMKTQHILTILRPPLIRKMMLLGHHYQSCVYTSLDCSDPHTRTCLLGTPEVECAARCGSHPQKHAKEEYWSKYKGSLCLGALAWAKGIFLPSVISSPSSLWNLLVLSNSCGPSLRLCRSGVLLWCLWMLLVRRQCPKLIDETLFDHHSVYVWRV